MTSTLDQSKESEHGVVHMAAGRPIHLPKIDGLDAEAELAVRFGVALEAVNNAHREMSAVSADQALSEYGKTQKLEPRRELLIAEVATQIDGLEKFEENLDRREAVLLAVPVLHPQNAADAIIDRELRDWWKGQDKGVRLDLLQKMNEEPGHERLEIALLRSPYAQADLEVKLARDAWNKAKRMEYPAEAEVIASGRNQIEWARKAFAQITPISALLSQLDDKKLLNLLIRDGRTEKTIEAFGFDCPSIARAKRMLQR